jgi:hypothetical protein
MNIYIHNEGGPQYTERVVVSMNREEEVRRAMNEAWRARGRYDECDIDAYTFIGSARQLEELRQLTPESPHILESMGYLFEHVDRVCYPPITKLKGGKEAFKNILKEAHDRLPESLDICYSYSKGFFLNRSSIYDEDVVWGQKASSLKSTDYSEVRDIILR